VRTVITTKGFKLSEKDKEKLGSYVSKLSRYLIQFREKLPILTFILRKDKKVSALPKEPSPFYYEGTIRLRLPKKSLVSHIREAFTTQAIEKGFRRILKELQTYKGKHFRGHSKYRSKESLKSRT